MGKNCLEGWRCPQCGNVEKFRIVGSALFTLTDEGLEDFENVHYDNNSLTYCRECNFVGTKHDFCK